jgi:glycosidase
MNLLNSHDTARAITLLGGDSTSVRLATLLLMTFPGAPCIFAGDEIGLEGGLPIEDARRSFPWDHPDLWRNDVLAYHQQLIGLRRAHKPLRRGTFHGLYADDNVIVFARRFSGEVVLVAVNSGEVSQRVEFPVEELYLAGEPVEVLYPLGEGAVWGEFDGQASVGSVERDRIGLTLAARSAVILKA